MAAGDEQGLYQEIAAAAQGCCPLAPDCLLHSATAVTADPTATASTADSPTTSLACLMDPAHEEHHDLDLTQGMGQV